MDTTQVTPRDDDRRSDFGTMPDVGLGPDMGLGALLRDLHRPGLIRRYRFQLAVALLLVMAGVASFAALAGAAEPVTDFANWPNPAIAANGTKPGCEGTDVQGVVFTFADGTVIPDLQSADIVQGDVITYSWAATAPECVGATMSWGLKSNGVGYFDPTHDQIITEQRTDTIITGGPQSLTVTFVHDDGEDCAVQADATVSALLSIVGPSGSFYSGFLRGDGGPELLVDHWNGILLPCAATGQTIPTVPSPPTTRLVPPPTFTTTVETAPGTTTSTTAEATTTTGAEPTTTTEPAYTCRWDETSQRFTRGGGGEPNRYQAASECTGSQVTSLPNTGRPSGNVALAGALVLAAGGALALAGRCHRRA